MESAKVVLWSVFRTKKMGGGECHCREITRLLQCITKINLLAADFKPKPIGQQRTKH